MGVSTEARTEFFRDRSPDPRRSADDDRNLVLHTGAYLPSDRIKIPNERAWRLLRHLLGGLSADDGLHSEFAQREVHGFDGFVEEAKRLKPLVDRHFVDVLLPLPDRSANVNAPGSADIDS